MKRSILLFLSLLSFYSSYAQQVVFSENFDGFISYNIIGWTRRFSNAVPWQAGLPYQVAPSVGGPMLVDAGTNFVAGIGDSSFHDRTTIIHNDSVFMSSPLINMTDIAGAWLSYDSYFLKYAKSGVIEKATVEISTDSGHNWTVLQDVPASTSSLSFTTYYMDLAAYNNLNNVHIGFRYKDGGLGNMRGWGIDNIKVFIPAHKDMKMIYLEQDTLANYVTLNQSFIHHGRVQNYGLDTVHAFVVKYQQEGKTIYADTITGVNIPSFGMYDFTYSVPDTVTYIGQHKVTLWVELAGDTIHSNDTIVNYLRGAYFYPKKRLLIEEGTGTHYYWGPQGWVYMNQIAVASDTLDVCEVSVHDGDPMEVADYDNYLLSCNYYPTYFLFDRRTNVGADTFFTALYKQKNYFGFADINLDGGINGTSLTVNAHIKPAIDLNGDYRLALVVTEDDVTGTSIDYAQQNIYTGNAYGPMGGFENKPKVVPAAEMYYNFVARKIVPSPDGDPGMLPTAMLHNNVYDYTFNTLVDRSWNTNRLKMIVMLINHSDSSVCNSNKLSLSLKTGAPSVALDNAGIYPNPARDAAIIHYNMEQQEQVTIFVTEMSGRTIYTLPSTKNNIGKNEITLPVGGMANGIYLVNIAGSTFRKSLKLEVVH